MRIHYGTNRKGCELIAWIGLLAPLFAVGSDSFPAKELIRISSRHQMPMSPKEARLVLAHTGTWQGLGNFSSLYPAIYSPASLLEEKPDGSIVILRGTEQQTVKKTWDERPLWLLFSDVVVEPKPGGYVTDFRRLSAFVCAVQCAAREDPGSAKAIWNRMSEALKETDDFSDGEPNEPASIELQNPRLLLARCIFDHYSKQILKEPSDWPGIYGRMKSLFRDFRQLKTLERLAVRDGLAAAIKAKPSTPDSTEALLVEWSRDPGSSWDIFEQQGPNKNNAPARRIILRGLDAVPDLIPLLTDCRITAHGYPAVMNSPSGIRLLGELADSLLAEITGTNATSLEGRPDGKAYRQWLERCRRVGEEKALAEGIFERRGEKITHVRRGPAEILAQKYPEILSGLCEEFSSKASPDAEAFYLAEAITRAKLPIETRVQVLAGFAQRGPLAHQRQILQELAKIDAAKCAEILLPILQKLPEDSEGPYWTCPEANLAHVVKRLEIDDVWREFLRAAKRSQVGLRLEMMTSMSYGYPYTGPGNRSRRLAFLATFLDDVTLRKMPHDCEQSKFKGPCAAFTFPRITVRDFVVLQIASILGLPDRPNELWTPSQWTELLRKVRSRLADETLPNLEKVK
ncbi:MAG: hypothetical protein DME24_06615 [Verrucomicrobia bacterium]|nr:MAG: hypothetical protein DME24_06615 [Verrucomicrobiota bacterium]